MAKRAATLFILASAAMLLGGAGPKNKLGPLNVAGQNNRPGVQQVEYETYTWLFRFDKFSPTAHAMWTADSLAADRIVVIPLDSLSHDWVAYKNFGSSGDSLLTNMTDALTHNDFTYMRQSEYNGSPRYVGTYPNKDAGAPDTYQEFGLMRWPLEAYLPANATIDSAQLKMVHYATTNSHSTTRADTLQIVLDTVAGDWAWWSGNKTGTATEGQRCASWNYQRQGATAIGYCTSGNGYPASSSYAWDPPLASRVLSIDWGPAAIGWVPTANTANQQSIWADITRIVQKQVTGSRNNGYWLLYKDDSPDGAQRARVYNFPKDADRNKCPYIKVTFSNKTYDGGPWWGKETVFVFLSNGNVKDANDAWSDIFAARGLSYSVAATGDLVGAENRATWDDIIGYRDKGMEITYGMLESEPYDAARSGGVAEYGLTEAGYDSVVMAMLPDSLYQRLADNDDSGRPFAVWAADPLVGKTGFFPQHGININAIAVADSLGYYTVTSYMRGLAQPNVTGATPADTCGANVGGPTGASALYLFGLRVPRKQNQMLTPLTLGMNLIMGTPAAPQADSTKVKRAVKYIIDDMAKRYNCPVVIYTHSLMDPAYSYTADGMSAEQCRWMLNAVAEMSDMCRVVTLSEMARYMRLNGVYYDHPAWGAEAWQTRLTGDRRVWWKGRWAQ